MTRMQQLDIPVRKWVPDWLGIVTVFVIILPVTMLNGSYTGSMLEVSSTLGVYTEDITIGYYAASAGMAVAYPVVPKILAAFSSKHLLLLDLGLQFFLSWICAYSSNIDILIAASFAIGFLKGAVMLWFIRRAQKIFSPKNVRSEFYAYFYPLVYGGGQLSMIVTAEIAYHYDWKYMYYFMMVLLMVAILFIIVFFRHDRESSRLPYRDLHIREMAIISTGILMLIYVTTYGKTLDWFASGRICAYVVIAPLLIALFVWELFHSTAPYVSLKPLFQWKSMVGYFYMIMVMFFSSSTSMMTSYFSNILKIDSVHSYSIYIFLIPGYMLGAFICFWWFRWQRWRFRFLVSAGMMCFAVFFAFLYFGVSPDSTYEMFFLPMFFRGLGMLVVIIAFALFVVEDLNPKHLLSNAFFLIIFRSVLSPVAASAFYGNMLYRKTHQYMVSLSENITMADPVSAARYSLSLDSAIAGGHGINEATQMATNSLYMTLQNQGLLLAMKDISGWLLAITFTVAVVSAFIPFHKTVRVPVIRTGEDMV